MSRMLDNNAADWITELIAAFVLESADNRMGTTRTEPIFDTPLVGFSSGSDPLYQEYVRHIGEFYLTPIRIFRKGFPDAPLTQASELTVISWILPSTEATRREQAARAKRPSERWCRTRYFGEKCNDALRQHVVTRLEEAGFPAVAPMLTDFWSRSDEGPYAPCSNWSERHAAYAAGLGTFGLCDGLITPVGKAIRTGSVIAKLSMEPTRRTIADHRAYCLFFSHGSCGKCIERCPVQALSPEGHDKKRCMTYTHGMAAWMRRSYGFETSACGLCQVEVPCMDHVPHPEEGI